MPLQNRVLPTGDIVAHPARGQMTGNRGIIHGNDRALGPSRWSHHAWISCQLEWQGRRRDVMTGRKWTELFFLDEAVALAAGHRPCGYCRRDAYRAFQAAWTQAFGKVAKAPTMDRVLHKARVGRDRMHIRHLADFNALPDGTFILHNDAPCLIWNQDLWIFSPNGYTPGPSLSCSEEVTVLTPVPIVAILQAGYRPELVRTG